MKPVRSLFLFVLISTAVFCLSSLSQKDWEVLGEKKINLSLESDEIKLGAKEGRFSVIKFKILDEPVFIHHIKIQYGNGTEETKVMKQKIKAGAMSNNINLPGNMRIIKKIKFLYKTNAKAENRATIVLLGK